MRSNWFCPQNPPPLCLAWNIVVCLAVGLNSCGCQKIESDRVCLVSSLPRTGVSRQVSDEVVRGIRLAIDEVKAKAGRFTLEYRDLDNSAAASGQWTSDVVAGALGVRGPDKEVEGQSTYLGPRPWSGRPRGGGPSPAGGPWGSIRRRGRGWPRSGR